jgi:hypothetical protein
MVAFLHQGFPANTQLCDRSKDAIPEDLSNPNERIPSEPDKYQPTSLERLRLDFVANSGGHAATALESKAVEKQNGIKELLACSHGIKGLLACCLCCNLRNCAFRQLTGSPTAPCASPEKG